MKQILRVVLCLAWIASIATLAAYGEPAVRTQRKAFESTLEGSQVRAGYPFELRRLSRATYTPDYEAGYVGGGVPAWGGGRGPTVHEGTWGRDYVGNRYLRQVWLRWSDGTRYQGGGGTYQTDGPKIFER